MRETHRLPYSLVRCTHRTAVGRQLAELMSRKAIFGDISPSLARLRCAGEVDLFGSLEVRLARAHNIMSSPVGWRRNVSASAHAKRSRRRASLRKALGG